MKPTTRWLLIALAGLALLVAPTLLRTYWLGYTTRSYVPAAQKAAVIAATPAPTVTPVAQNPPPAPPQNELKRGPVVVDLAHGARIARNSFQPLASALAARGLEVIFWTPAFTAGPGIDPADYPDQSDALTQQLVDASALVVVSPYYTYNPREVAVVEKFVADGGRLILISDPDVEGDLAQDANILAAPFSIVFNEDYLYDTVDNDENFTHFFQGEFADRAEGLAGSRIAFYGGRSIGGAIIPQARTASTTLSSLRTGQTDLVSLAIGGQVANNSLGRVLAMSDFDVLTEPYVMRHDNRKLLDYVANFVAGAQRSNTIADFPAFLGKEVALVIDNTQPVGALGLSKAAELQIFLESTGRVFKLAPNNWLDETQGEPGVDLIYIAGYRAADAMTTLLSDLGVTLVEEVVTTTTAPAAPVLPPLPPVEAPTAPPTVPAAPTPLFDLPSFATPEPPPELPDPLDPVAPPASTPAPDLPPVEPPAGPPVAPTATETADTLMRWQPPATPEEPAEEEAPPVATPVAPGADRAAAPAPEAPPAATPAGEPELYLVRQDGIRLVADETQFFIQRPYHGDMRVLAVLGNSEQAINAGLTRLLTRNFYDCINQENLVICPVMPGGEPSLPAPAATPAATPTGAPATRPESAPGGPVSAQPILLVDDDSGAQEGEESEAATYLFALGGAGYQVDYWSTRERGFPDDATLAGYAWVIWSDAGYAASGISGESLRLINNFINQGGHLTMSSRMPFYGVANQPSSTIKDLVLDDDIPELVAGLPREPIQLTGSLPAVPPLESEPEPSTGARIAMRRGPASGSATAPVLVVYSDENFAEPQGALLMLFGMSVAWLPGDVGQQLILNMADVMLAE